MKIYEMYDPCDQAWSNIYDSTSQPNHTFLAIEAKVLAKQTNKQTE